MEASSIGRIDRRSAIVIVQPYVRRGGTFRGSPPLQRPPPSVERYLTILAATGGRGHIVGPHELVARSKFVQ